MLTNEQIFTDLKDITAKLLRINFEDIEKIAHYDSTLKNDLGIDSVESLDLLHELETRYGIEINDAEAAKLEKVSDVIDLVLSKKGY